MLFVFKVQKRLDTAVGDNNDVASLAAVSAIGPGIPHPSVPVITFTPLPAVAGLDTYPCFIDECHHSCFTRQSS